jgi:hypothetical protein
MRQPNVVAAIFFLICLHVRVQRAFPLANECFQKMDRGDAVDHDHVAGLYYLPFDDNQSYCKRN